MFALTAAHITTNTVTETPVMLCVELIWGGFTLVIDCSFNQSIANKLLPLQ